MSNINKYFKRKDGIIIDAIKLMDEKGLHGLTTREIAARQGVTEPAIYRQFKSKNDIIKAILLDFSKYDKAIASTIMENIKEMDEALIYFGKLYSNYYENYPEIVSIMFSIEYLKTDKELFEIFSEILAGRKKAIIDILIEFGGNSLESLEEFAEILMSLLIAQTMFWKMEGCTYSLTEKIEKNIRFLLIKYGGKSNEKDTYSR